MLSDTALSLVTVIDGAQFHLMAVFLIVVAFLFSHLPITELMDIAANGKPIP